MPERRYAPLNGSLTDSMKSEDATITGDWTFTGTVDLSSSTLSLPSNVPLTDAAESITGAWNFDNTVKVRYSGDTADYLSIQHSGTDVLFNTVNAAYYRWNSTDEANITGHLHLHGLLSRWYDDDNTNYIDIRQVDESALIQTSGTGFESLKLRTNASTGSQFSIGGQGSTNVADDASVEYTFNGTAYGIWFVTTSFNGTTFAIFAHTGATTYPIYTGTTVSLGASGTNPDVDGDANYWCDGAGNLHIKNRLGSPRRFNAYHMAG